LIEKLSTYNVTDFLLVKELHAVDDLKSRNRAENHVHVYLELSRSVDIKNSSFLDLTLIDEGKNSVYHGNYQRCKNTKSTLNYLLKEVDAGDSSSVLMSEGLQIRIGDFGELLNLDESLIKLAEKGEIKKALDLIKKNRPWLYLKSHMHLEKSLKDLYLKTLGCVPKYNFNQFQIPDELRALLSLAEKTNRTVHLFGDSGTGKSQFIKCYTLDVKKLNPLIINNFDALRFFNFNTHNAIIIDDIANLDKLKREEIIKFFDSEEETTFSLKHGSTRIPQSTPRFLITNHPLERVLGEDYTADKAISRRIVSFNLEGKTLFLRK
jgi:hypothetical protein